MRGESLAIPECTRKEPCSLHGNHHNTIGQEPPDMLLQDHLHPAYGELIPSHHLLTWATPALHSWPLNSAHQPLAGHT